MKNLLSLKEFQHRMLGLIKGNYRPGAGDDAYFNEVYQSENLELVKVIILWWRQNHIERYCFFTSRLLVETNQLQTLTAQYFKASNHSSFIEEMSCDFLKWVMQSAKGLLQAVARFEYGMIQLKKGIIYADEFFWPCEPLMVIQGLIDGDFSNLLIEEGPYRMVISSKIDRHFLVEDMRKDVAA